MFRRQQPIGPYFVDFYCHAARLAVEIDGPVHWGKAQSAYDLRRQAWLEFEGKGVVRVQVAGITRSLGAVLGTIDGVLRATLTAEGVGAISGDCQHRAGDRTSAPEG